METWTLCIGFNNFLENYFTKKKSVAKKLKKYNKKLYLFIITSFSRSFLFFSSYNIIEIASNSSKIRIRAWLYMSVLRETITKKNVRTTFEIRPSTLLRVKLIIMSVDDKFLYEQFLQIDRWSYSPLIISWITTAIEKELKNFLVCISSFECKVWNGRSYNSVAKYIRAEIDNDLFDITFGGNAEKLEDSYKDLASILGQHYAVGYFYQSPRTTVLITEIFNIWICYLRFIESHVEKNLNYFATHRIVTPDIMKTIATQYPSVSNKVFNISTNIDETKCFNRVSSAVLSSTYFQECLNNVSGVVKR